MIIKKTKKGFGVYAGRFYRKSEVICVMKGRKRKGWALSMNPLQVGLNVYIDLARPFVYINHSCNPNCGVRGRTTLFALRDIRKGEEITYDYSTTVDETFLCKCGAKRCRRYVPIDFWGLQLSQKRSYLKRNAVPAYIKKKFEKSLK